jgi:hypothetical protein
MPDLLVLKLLQISKCILVLLPFFVLGIVSVSYYDTWRTIDVPDTVPNRTIIKAAQGITGVVVSKLLHFLLKRNEEETRGMFIMRVDWGRNVPSILK